MRRFEFSTTGFEVDIAGVKLGGDAEMIKIDIINAHNELVKFSEKVLAGKAERAELEEQIGGFCSRLDSAFGEGAASEIFNGRAANLHDCVDIAVYIMTALNEYEEKKRSEQESYKLNRAQLRKVKK